MKYFLIVGSFLFFVSIAQAATHEELAAFLTNQGTNSPSVFNSDLPPGLLQLQRAQDRKIAANAAINHQATVDAFIMAESARRDTMIQLMAPEGSRLSPMAQGIVSSFGAQLDRNAEISRIYKGYGR